MTAPEAIPSGALIPVLRSASSRGRVLHESGQFLGTSGKNPLGEMLEFLSRRPVLQLSGFVSDAGDVPKAGAVARSVKGVTSVKNDLRVKGRQ